MSLPSSNRTVSGVLQISALATLVIGVATLISPGTIVSWFDGEMVDNFHFVRFIGTALIGFSVTNWIYSKTTDLSNVLPAIYGNLTSLILAIIVDFIGIVLKLLSPMAWLILLLHVIFAAAFMYCVVLIKKNESDPKTHTL